MASRSAENGDLGHVILRPLPKSRVIHIFAITACGSAAFRAMVAAMSTPSHSARRDAQIARGPMQGKTGPDFSAESALAEQGARRIAGVDEAGRGPWAGPVVAAAVWLDPAHAPDGLNDSKKLSAGARENLFDLLTQLVKAGEADIGVGIAEIDRIDRDNILRASLWAMSQAVDGLTLPPDHALVDGTQLPQLACPAMAMTKGDGRSVSIAAASIIAKVTRDRIMRALAQDHPGYGWERNMGYGTAEHRAGLARLGVTAHHRRSFRPIRLALRAAIAGTQAAG